MSIWTCQICEFSSTSRLEEADNGIHPGRHALMGKRNMHPRGTRTRTVEVAEGAPARRPRGAERWAGAARVLTLAGSDVLALWISGGISFIFWAAGVRSLPARYYAPLSPVAIMFVLAYAQARLYPGFGLGPVEVLRRYWLVTGTGFLALAALVFVLKVDTLYYSRMTLLLTFVSSLAALPLFRHVTIRIGRKFSWWAEPAVLVTTADASKISQDRSAWPLGEIQVVSLLKFDQSDLQLPEAATVIEAEALARSGVRVAVADIDGPDAPAFIDRLRLLFPRVLTIRNIKSLPVEGVQIRKMAGSIALEYSNNLLRRQSRWVKRSMDFLLALVALIVGTPLMLLAMAAVKLSSPGPALFFQERVGLRGDIFRVPKIRTMSFDAEKEMATLLELDAEIRQLWQSNYKLRNDPRIVPGIGKFLRRYSIDELPQLLTVLKGEMSLVGPRPFPQYHLDAISDHSRWLRSEVRPGITGLWQIEARGAADLDVQQAYDLYYVRNWSIWLDIYILVRTLGAVVSGRGAH